MRDSQSGFFRTLCVRALPALFLLSSSLAARAACPPETVWTDIHNSPSNDVDTARDVVVDSAGNIIVVGYEERLDLGQAYDWLIRKYNPDGGLLWERSYDSPANSWDYAEGVAVDSFDNVVVTGYEERADIGEGRNWVVRKYDADGNFLWHRTYHSGAANNDIAYAVETDPADNIVVGGYEDRVDIGEGNNWKIIKYSSSGNPLWSTTYSTGPGSDTLMDLAVDDNGGIAAVGACPGTSYDWRIRRYTPSGTLAWEAAHNGPGNDVDYAYAVALAPSGSVFVAGYVRVGGTNSDLHVRAYDPSGNGLWNATYGGAANQPDRAEGLDVLSDGGIVVVGTEANGVTSLVRKYGKLGNLAWAFGLTGGSSNILSSVAAGASGEFFVAGRTAGSGGSDPDWILRKYLELQACLSGQISTSSIPVYVGDWFTIALTVTNNGDMNATGVTPVIEANQGGSLIDIVAAPPPLAALVPGGGTVFEWTFSVSGVGTVSFTASASGVDSGTGYPVLYAGSQGLILTATAHLESSLSFAPDAGPVGGWFNAILTVTNTGQYAADAVAAAIEANSGGSLVTLLASPAPLASLPAGGSTDFSWTFSASGKGLVTFTASAAGTDSVTAVPVAAAASGSLSTLNPASIGATLALSSTALQPGLWVTASLSVTNTGDYDLVNVKPGMWASLGGGLVALQNGPVPPGPLILGPGGSTVFIWTYSVSGSGGFNLSATVSGTDVALGKLRGAGRLASLMSYAPASLQGRLILSPVPAVTGQWITVTLSVTNGGEVTAEAVTPALDVNEGGTLVVSTGGPVPAGPVNMPPGSSQFFAWTYSVSGSGAISFTASASGTIAGLGAPVTASATALMTALASARLESGLSVFSGNSTVEGQSHTIALTISNTGGVTANAVTPSLALAPDNGGSVSWIRGPTPAGAVNLAPGAVQVYIWTYSATAAGGITYSATATGTDAVSGKPLAAPAYPVRVTIGPRSLLLAELTVPAADSAPVREGQAVSVWLKLSNTGGNDVRQVVASLDVSDSSLAEVLRGPEPAGAVDVPPGGEAYVSWTVRAERAGPLTLTAAAAGLMDGKPVSVSAADTLTIRMTPKGAGAYPNPVTGDSVSVVLSLKGAAREVRLDVYNAAFDRVHSAVWDSVEMEQAEFVMRGLSGWAPGMYIVRAVAAFSDGSRQKFPFVKVMVKR